MPDDAYRTAVKGSLKLKGVKDGGIKKKSKKSTAAAPSSSSSNHDALSSNSSSKPTSTMTEAERIFLEKQKRRRMQEIEKLAKKSHKEKVAEFNEKLERLPEHYDIPKVGPG